MFLHSIKPLAAAAPAILIAILVVALLTPVGRADVPLYTSYQGRVRVGGAEFTGTGHFKFALVAKPGGATVWSNDSTSVNGSEPKKAVSLPVTGGVFTVLLGDLTLKDMAALPADLFSKNAKLDLRVWFNDGVNGSVRLFPDTVLASVPYALSAHVPAAAIQGAHLGQGVIDAGKLASINAPGPGNVLTHDGTRFRWAPSGTAGNLFSASGPDAYYHGGRIGIGTSTPAAALHVGGGGLAVTGSGSPYQGAGAGAFLEYNAPYGAFVFSYDYAADAPRNLLLNSPGGHVGIGTIDPAAPLDVRSEWSATGLPNIRLSGPHPTIAWVESSFPAFPRHSWIAHLNGVTADLQFWHRAETGLVGGDTSWHLKAGLTEEGGFHYAGKLEKLDTADRFTATVRSADLQLGHTSRRGTPGRALVDWKDDAGSRALVVNWNGDWPATIIGGAVTEVKSLRITGGADLAEPFPMSHLGVTPGDVVVIDERNPGKLRISDTPYDTKVAGIVSGANGLGPGISMIQEDQLEPGENVALSGRVHVKANITGGVIEPGDLLTTSGVRGEAMRAGLSERARGAILGKAMTGLEDGPGTVLVLVSLQ